jgi:sec-independent protein translocase protein TatC
MTDAREDDLFRESTMTFGQHLEELRACLFKSILGLIVGFSIGLLVGNQVVGFIQSPLLKALNNFYQKESKQRVTQEIEKIKKSGKESPWTDEQVKTLVEDKNLFADVFYVDPEQMLRELKNVYPDRFKRVESLLQAADSDNFRIRVATAFPVLMTSIVQAVPQAACCFAMEPPMKTASTKGPPDAAAAKPELVPLFLWHESKDDPRVQAKAMATTEPFAIWVKASLLVGVIISSPWVFYQIWSFVAAGLYPKERRYVQRYLPFSLGLFLTGAALAFFVVFEPVLNFLLSFNRSQGIVPELRINEWLSFVLILPVGFGIGFQLPLVMLFLERIGVFTVQAYLKGWRIAVLVIFVIAAILTPPDAYSMLLLAGSLTFLYFGGILLCKLLPRQSSPFEPSSPQ